MQIRIGLFARLNNLLAQAQQPSNERKPFDSNRPYFNGTNVASSSVRNGALVARFVASTLVSLPWRRTDPKLAQRLERASVRAARAQREAEGASAVREAERIVREHARRVA